MKLFGWLPSARERTRVAACVDTFLDPTSTDMARQAALHETQKRSTAVTAEYLASLTDDRSPRWLAALEVRHALTMIGDAEFRTELLRVATAQYPTHPLQIDAVRILARTPDSALTGTYISLIRRGYENGKHELDGVCTDALVAIGASALDDLIAWYRKRGDYHALDVIVRIRDPRCEAAIAEDLEKARAELARHESENTDSARRAADGARGTVWALQKRLRLLRDPWEFKNWETERIENLCRSVQKETESRRWSEWRAAGGRNALTCPVCGTPRATFSLQPGKLHAKPNCEKCGFNYSGLS